MAACNSESGKILYSALQRNDFEARKLEVFPSWKSRQRGPWPSMTSWDGMAALDLWTPGIFLIKYSLL